MGKDPCRAKRCPRWYGRWPGPAAVLTLILLLSLGCVTPKRLPPVATSEQLPAAPSIVPLLLGVGLAEQESNLTLTSTGPCVILDGGTGKLLARTVGSSEPLSCRRAGSGVSWLIGGKEGQAGSVVVQPIDPEHRVCRDDALYRGEFLVIPTPAKAAGLTLVNNVELEAYLRGVVPWEIGRHGPDRMAALAAQAVAARTYTVAHIGARQAHGFDLFADVMDQVYRGCAQEDSLCNQAIDQTSGQILRWQGEEISAYYSACCGGVTSQLEEVWALPGQPYLITHTDGPGRGQEPYCAGSRHFQWTEKWTAVRLTEILQKTLPVYTQWAGDSARQVWAGPVFRPSESPADPARPGRLLDMKISQRTTSGRVAKLEIATEAGVYTVRGDRVRWVLQPAGGRYAILRSALFDLTLSKSDEVLTGIEAVGHGFGHGIGLCQIGALEMARRGRSAQEILAHYYPGAELTRIR